MCSLDACYTLSCTCRLHTPLMTPQLHSFRMLPLRVATVDQTSPTLSVFWNSDALTTCMSSFTTPINLFGLSLVGWVHFQHHSPCMFLVFPLHMSKPPASPSALSEHQSIKRYNIPRQLYPPFTPDTCSTYLSVCCCLYLHFPYLPNSPS